MSLKDRLLNNRIIFKAIPAMFMVGILVSCGNDLESIKEFSFSSDDPSETMDSVTIQISDNGLVRYVLTSKIIEKYLINEVEEHKFPKGFKLEVYDTLGVLENTVSALKADMYKAKGMLILEDSVHLVNVNKEQLRTEYLEIYFDKDSIHTNKPVTVSSLSGTIRGKNGLTSNLNFTRYKLLKIKGDIVTKDLQNE